MKLALATVGTHGDVVPFVALGRALRREGHEVVLASHIEHRGFVERHDLEFRDLGGSMKAVLGSKEGRDWVESGDSLLRYNRTARRVFRPMLQQSFLKITAALRGAEAVLFHPFCVQAQAQAAGMGVPQIGVALCPV